MVVGFRFGECVVGSGGGGYHGLWVLLLYKFFFGYFNLLHILF